MPTFHFVSLQLSAASQEAADSFSFGDSIQKAGSELSKREKERLAH